MSLKSWRRIRKIKEATKLVDAKLLFNAILNVKDEDREQLKKDMEDSFEKNGKLMVERAFLEKVLTPFEYADMHTKYSFDDKDFGTILMAYFGKNGKDKIHVLTMAYSTVYKAKDFIKERFGLDVVSTSEFLVFARKEDPKLFAEFMKEHNMNEDDFNKMVEEAKRYKE